eukprot:CAMPEP_0168527276 /NCGR_PEP_ID=MMETSP0405-20121227/12497_1 /TAXON_ID=498012 /ORGANISM="Trichosphaerium sp, Strain Am-I-7 wt" /LENGTH=32 /DNA_ID= /DNA_START= /DNA_END= /DNA_ORIENTATION=
MEDYVRLGGTSKYKEKVLKYNNMFDDLDFLQA